MSANIEELNWSLIASDIRFTLQDFDIKKVIQFRKAHLTITDMIWITKQPIIDFANNLYNPKTLILIFLN